MNDSVKHTPIDDELPDKPSNSFDYDFVSTTARIALYDDLRSAPRITEITPARTTDYIESLASKIYEQAKMAGGAIPYTAIREVSENFIHAKFAEVVVSILDEGNTIRFADQGPGIASKEKAQMPGFSSAIEPMKKYIRGVGSGLPIVKEYLDFSHGTISIEDNLVTGAVVTISLKDEASTPPEQQLAANGNGMGRNVDNGADKGNFDLNGGFDGQSGHDKARFASGRGGYAEYIGQRSGAYPGKTLVPPLSQREREFLAIFLSEGALGVTDMKNLSGVAQSSTYVTFGKLEEAGLIEKTAGQKRILTEYGFQVASEL